MIQCLLQCKTVLQIDIRKKYGLNILGIRVNGKMDMNITPDTFLPEENSILVLGHLKTIQKYFHI